MSIYLYCKECKSTSPTQKQKCSRCGKTFPKDDRKYRVSVTVKGKTVTRMVGFLEDAKNAEAAIRNDLVNGESKPTAQAVTLDDLWSRYLSWAKESLHGETTNTII